MPDGVAEAHFLGRIKDSTDRVAEATCDQPDHAVRADSVAQLGHHYHHKPPHQEIAGERQPGIPVPIQDLGQDSGRRQRPHRRKQPPTGVCTQRHEQEWRAAASDQQINRAMIEQFEQISVR